MSRLAQALSWTYRYFGISSIYATGRNAYLIILARSLRMFAFGTTFILALFFNELGFTDYQIGLFFTLTLLGDVILGTLLTLVADHVGRRRILLAGSALMIISGVVFAYFENFFILLPAAIVGVISATGGDFGPFRSIEESMLSQLTTPDTRADVLTWYVTIALLGSALGSEAAGRIIDTFQSRAGWTLLASYHALFWLYAIMGSVNACLVLLMTDACELDVDDDAGEYSRLLPEDDARLSTEGVDDITVDGATVVNPDGVHLATSKSASSEGWFRRYFGWISASFSNISAPTRSTMYKLWILLALDSVSDGMVPPSITNYFVDQKFHPDKSTLGDVQSTASLLGSIGTIFAAPLARQIGLINTMVFTHVPSSAAVLLFPLPSAFWLTAVLLFVRTGLNSMDQAPRSAFIAAVVRPEERTAVMGITAMVRTLAATTGPSITGILAGNNRFWIAFVVAGACRLTYDFGLWMLFVNTPLSQHEDGGSVLDDEEEHGTSEGSGLRNGEGNVGIVSK
ncbi:hypothetical protein PpBr36_00167 [Pyricularia pennisetigena]|uniref:hypothetical protein n=1 Tax=Pyricularia pennisetigena TaxID=1578925 RepID=UPI00114E50F4|nr:hypothetical protein PpBr36_00167 [Pyricularia pennisetigena]TLS29400.1 hypothetical protein PpBr36_00167 [Pyricularia pennisetigena]